MKSKCLDSRIHRWEMDDGILDGRGRYSRTAANENFSWMYNVWRRWAAPIRKLIEHLRIESKPDPVGIDILDIGGWFAFNTRWRRENCSGKQWLPGLRRRSDDNGCDRLFRDVTCPRFSCNFIRLMTARDGPRICSPGKKNNQRLFPETVIYSFSKKNNPFFFPPPQPSFRYPRSIEGKDAHHVKQYLITGSLRARLLFYTEYRLCIDLHISWNIKECLLYIDADTSSIWFLRNKYKFL